MPARLIPLIGVGTAVVLFAIATSQFPGGYHWTHDYICTLLRSSPDRLLPSKIRMLAIAAVLCYSAALGFLYYQLSVFSPTRFLGKTLQIAGIASVVYGSFAMTVIHDLVVTISFISSVIAAAALMHWLYLRRAHSLLLLGAMALMAQGVTAVLFYGRHFGMALSLAQKVEIALTTGWLLSSHASLIPLETKGREKT